MREPELSAGSPYRMIGGLSKSIAKSKGCWPVFARLLVELVFDICGDADGLCDGCGETRELLEREALSFGRKEGMALWSGCRVKCVLCDMCVSLYQEG